MKSRVIFSGLLAALVLGGPVQAQDFAAAVVSQLRGQGFGTITEETTLLGRVRIKAVRKDGTREIIINPRTGEILRDLWTPSAGDASVARIVDDPLGSGNGQPAEDGASGGASSGGSGNSGGGSDDGGGDSDDDGGDDSGSGGDDSGGSGDDGGGDDGGDDDGGDDDGDDDGGDDGDDD